jgi:hypothetical protein
VLRVFFIYNCHKLFIFNQKNTSGCFLPTTLRAKTYVGTGDGEFHICAYVHVCHDQKIVSSILVGCTYVRHLPNVNLPNIFLPFIRFWSLYNTILLLGIFECSIVGNCFVL